MQFNLTGLHNAAEFPPAEPVRAFQPDSLFEGKTHNNNPHDYIFHCRGLSKCVYVVCMFKSESA